MASRMLMPIVLRINLHSSILNVNILVVQIAVTHFKEEEDGGGVKLGENRRSNIV